MAPQSCHRSKTQTRWGEPPGEPSPSFLRLVSPSNRRPLSRGQLSVVIGSMRSMRNASRSKTGLTKTAPRGQAGDSPGQAMHARYPGEEKPKPPNLRPAWAAASRRPCPQVFPSPTSGRRGWPQAGRGNPSCLLKAHLPTEPPPFRKPTHPGGMPACESPCGFPPWSSKHALTETPVAWFSHSQLTGQMKRINCTNLRPGPDLSPTASLKSVLPFLLLFGPLQYFNLMQPTGLQCFITGLQCFNILN
jgi:hypothetical protein